jgi:hypothetical protein
MYAFDEQIGSDNCLFSEMIDHCGIITHSNDRGCVLQFDVLGQMMDQTEFTVVGNFCSWFHPAKLRHQTFFTCGDREVSESIHTGFPVPMLLRTAIPIKTDMMPSLIDPCDTRQLKISSQKRPGRSGSFALFARESGILFLKIVG